MVIYNVTQEAKHFIWGYTSSNKFSGLTGCFKVSDSQTNSAKPFSASSHQIICDFFGYVTDNYDFEISHISTPAIEMTDHRFSEGEGGGIG